MLNHTVEYKQGLFNVNQRVEYALRRTGGGSFFCQTLDAPQKGVDKRIVDRVKINDFDPYFAHWVTW
jgi:hypothetical protein